MKYIVWITIAIVVVVGIALIVVGRQSSLNTPMPSLKTAELSPLSVGLSKFTVPVSVPLEAFDTILERMAPEKMSGSNELDFGIQMNWSVSRSPFTISTDNGDVMISTELDGSATFTKKILVEAHSTIKLRGRAWLIMRPTINEEWRIVPDLEMNVEVFRSEHKIFNLIYLNLSEFLQPHIADFFNMTLEKLETFVNQNDILEQFAREEWMKLCQTVKISTDPDLWLEIEPKTVRVSQIRIGREHLHSQLGIDTAIRVSSSEIQSTCRFPDQLIVQPNKPNRIEIVLLAEIDYDTLALALSDLITDEAFGDGLPVTVHELTIHPHGGSLMLEIQVSIRSNGWLSKFGNGTVYVLAEPDLSADGQAILLKQVQLETTFENAIMSALGRASEARMLNLLEEQATFRLDSIRKQILGRINTVLNELSSRKIEVDARIDNIRLIRIDVGPEYLRGVATLDGNAAVLVKEISFETR